MPSILFNGGSSAKRLSPTEAAYLAGFVDGEGCLTIGRAKQRESRAGFTYMALFTIANTNLAVLHQIVAMCGNGKIQLADKRNAIGHKTLYRIVFGHGHIRHVLPQIRPFLRVKGPQADLLLRFLETKISGKVVTADNWQRWEQWRADIRGMNKRGIIDVSPEQLIVRTDVRFGEREKSVRRCAVEGCEVPHAQRGYCMKHLYALVLKPQRPQRGPYDKTCVVCGVAFVTKRVNAECCSKRCIAKRYYAANAERIKAQVVARQVAIAAR